MPTDEELNPIIETKSKPLDFSEKSSKNKPDKEGER
jgi:hypothetical protein